LAVTPQPADSRLHRPPQFGLRTLLLVITACAVLFAMAHWMPPIAWVGVLLLVTSVTLHVAGNAIGTRLRQLGDRPPPEFEDKRRADGVLLPHEFAPVTRLGQRQSLGWSIVVATAVGVLSGGAGGGIWTWISSRSPAGPLQIVVGVIAFGALGGMAAFATVAFTQVLLGALWQALHPPTANELGRDLSKM
jgi:hypothetical protein